MLEVMMDGMNAIGLICFPYIIVFIIIFSTNSVNIFEVIFPNYSKQLFNCIEWVRPP